MAWEPDFGILVWEPLTVHVQNSSIATAMGSLFEGEKVASGGQADVEYYIGFRMLAASRWKEVRNQVHDLVVGHANGFVVNMDVDRGWVGRRCRYQGRE